MKQVGVDMSRFTVEKSSSTERGMYYDMFLARLNPPRLAGGFNKLSPAFLAKKLQGIPTADLHAFYQQCERANNFSRYFWWALRPNTYTSDKPNKYVGTKEYQAQ
jgi:hypothetical protein